MDSPDGGRTFPVYAPKMHTRRFDQAITGGSGGCLEDPAWNVDGVDIFTEGGTAANPDKAADGSEAGWTPTIVPCLSSSDRAGPDGVDVRDQTKAMVRVEPDLGAGGPGSGEAANEWYGVPHVLLGVNARRWSELYSAS